MIRASFVATLALVLLQNGCAGNPLQLAGLNPAGSSLAQAHITDIQFGSRPTDINVLFDIDVSPSGISPDTGVFVVLLSKDGHYYSSHPVAWTKVELEGVSTSERDYERIRIAQSRTVKNVTLAAPANDKDIVPLVKDYQTMVQAGNERQARRLQDYLKNGDMVSYLKEGQNPWQPSSSDVEAVANKYVSLVVVDRDGLRKLQYPNGERRLLAKYSGKGSFTTPLFSPKYPTLITSWIGSPPSQFEYQLYSEEGRLLSGAKIPTDPNTKRGSGDVVTPGKRYYIKIIAPPNSDWTFWVEETNFPD